MPRLDALARFGTRLLRGAALVVLVGAGLASIVASGGGVSGSGDDGLGPLTRTYLGSVAVTPEIVDVAPGRTVTVRVDTNLLPPGDGVTGYAIGLSESDARIQIATVPCPVGAGSASCQDWTITPDADAVPGEHVVDIASVGARSGDLSGTLRIRVIGAGVSTAARAIDHGAAEPDPFNQFDGPTLVLLTDGRIAAAGANGGGEVGVGYRPFQVGRSGGSGRFTPRPWFVDQFVVVANGTEFQRTVNNISVGRWTAVAASARRSFALRDDKTVWAWGVPPGSLGSDEPFAPRMFTQLPPIKAISAGRTSGALALAEDKTAWSLENLDYQFHLSQLPPKQIKTSSASPLQNITAIAGSVDATALFITEDGSAWIQHDGEDVARPLPGLGAAATRIATTRYRKGISRHYYLILLANGSLVEGHQEGGDEVYRTVALPGADFTEIAAGALYAYALRSDGSVWSWQPFASSPARVAGLADVVALGPDHAIRGSCPNRSGQVWRILNGSDAARLPGFNFDVGCVGVSDPAVTLTVDVTGPGIVEVLPQGVACRDHCVVDVTSGALVRLRAFHNNLPIGTGDPRCTIPGLKDETALSLTSSISCSYAFPAAGAGAVEQPALTIVLDGPGSVTSSPPGFNCGSACSGNLPAYYTFLTATPAAGYQFDGFIGAWDCERGVINSYARSGAEPGAMSPICTARFVPVAPPPSSRLDVLVVGPGVVVSTPAAINCGSVCSAVFPVGATVALDPQPGPGHRFAGWDGHSDCNDNSLTLSVATTCTANFELIAPPPAPLNLRASASAGSIELSWVGPLRPVGSYELTRTPGIGGDPSRTVVFAAPARSFVDTAVASNTAYRYELVARHSGGVSPAAVALATTPDTADWGRVGAADIAAAAAFAQPALALGADGNTLAVAHVITGPPDQPQVFANDVFGTNSWTHLTGTPGGGLLPAAAGTQPSLALDSQGTAVVAWTQSGPAGNDVRVARFDSATAQWIVLGGALDVDLGAPALNDATQAVLALDDADQPIVAWLQGGNVYVKRWDGVASWLAVGGNAGIAGAGSAVNGVRLVLDAAGTAQVLLRQGVGSAAQLHAFRESGAGWQALGGALNAPLGAPRDSLPLFELVIDVDGSPLALWSEGQSPYWVLARRWRAGAWQALPDVVAFERDYAITGLGAARSVQATTIPNAPLHVMVARQPVFAGSNPHSATGLVFLLDSADVWQARPALVTSGPMFGLTLRITRTATPIAAWVAESGASGGGEFRVFVWRARY